MIKKNAGKWPIGDTMNVCLHKKWITIVSVFLCTIVFYGCTPSMSDLEQKISGPSSIDPSLEEALSSATFEAGEWPSENWWEMFQDPQLNALILQAVEDSPTIKKAEAQVDYAKQVAKRERAALFPELDFNATENWQHLSKNGLYRSYFPLPAGSQPPPPTLDLIDVQLNFSYEFDFWGKYRKTFNAALGVAKSQEAEAAQATLVLATSVALAYFDLQSNQATLTILRQMLDERKQALDLANARQEYGLTNQIPTLGSEQNIFTLEQLILATEQEIIIDKHMLMVLLGQGPDSPQIIEDPRSSFVSPFPLPMDISSDLLARRPDLMAQIWTVESAAYQIGAAKTDFYPSFSLGAMAGLESITFNKLFKISSRQGSLNPAIHLPIFTAGRIKANVLTKVAEFETAVYQYNDLLLQAAKQVADEITTLRTVNDQLLVQGRNLESYQATYALNLSRFEQGVSNYLDVLSAEDAFLNQQLTEVDLLHNRLNSAVRLIKALGGGYETYHEIPKRFEAKE